MPRYVILEHDHPTLHYDFMLQAGEVLRTWRLMHPPTVDQPMQAQASFDHRLHYLDYEGPVSGERGRVRRWDTGRFDWEIDEPRRIAVLLYGQQLQGRGVLEQNETGNWTLTISTAAHP